MTKKIQMSPARPPVGSPPPAARGAPPAAAAPRTEGSARATLLAVPEAQGSPPPPSDEGVVAHELAQPAMGAQERVGEPWVQLSVVAVALGLPSAKVRRLLDRAGTVAVTEWYEAGSLVWISPEGRAKLAAAVAEGCAGAVEAGVKAREPELFTVMRIPLNPAMVEAKKSPDAPWVSIRVRSQRIYRVGGPITARRTQGASYEEITPPRNPFAKRD